MNLNLRVSTLPKPKTRIRIPFRAVITFLENDLFYYRGRFLELKLMKTFFNDFKIWILLREDGVIFQGAHGSPVLTYNHENKISNISKLVISAIQPHRFKKEEALEKLEHELGEFALCSYKKDTYRVYPSHYKLFNAGEKNVTHPYTNETASNEECYLPF